MKNIFLLLFLFNFTHAEALRSKLVTPTAATQIVPVPVLIPVSTTEIPVSTTEIPVSTTEIPVSRKAGLLGIAAGAGAAAAVSRVARVAGVARVTGVAGALFPALLGTVVWYLVVKYYSRPNIL